MFFTNYNVIFLSIVLSVSSLVSGQGEHTPFCGTTTTTESLDFISRNASQIQIYKEEFLAKRSGKNNLNRILNSIPIKAHVIRSSNGTGGLSTSNLNKALTDVNAIFKEAFMEFFLCDGINYIDESKYCHFKKGNEADLKQDYYTPGLINIYFVDDLKSLSGENICGYSNNIGRANDIIIMSNDCATNSSSLAHELGHFFSLLHTHGPDNTKITSELVDGSNCDTDGDGICDTPADPKLSAQNINNFCEFTGTDTDANGHTFTPDTGNLMSYSRKSCRNHFTPQQLARMYAFYQTTKRYLTCPSFNANLSADISSTCEENLTVNFKNQCSGITNWEWDIDSDGVIDYTVQNPSHTYEAGIYDVTLTVSNKSKTIKKTFSKLIKVGTEIDALQEDFKDFSIAGDQGWTSVDVSESGYNWYSNSGATTTDGTGPLIDHTTSKTIGTYIYAEASGANPGDIAEFISPCIHVTPETSKLEFSYHMYGQNMGALHVDIKTDDGYINDVIEPLVGSQQTKQHDPFLKRSIELSSYENQTIKIRFRAIRGASWDGDIAIDNIIIKNEEPKDLKPVQSLFEVIAYPNPITNDNLYIKTGSSQDIWSYKITNLVGQTSKVGTLTSQPINVSDLSSGTYFITIHNADSKIIKKIVK